MLVPGLSCTVKVHLCATARGRWLRQVCDASMQCTAVTRGVTVCSWLDQVRQQGDLRRPTQGKEEWREDDERSRRHQTQDRGEPLVPDEWSAEMLDDHAAHERADRSAQRESERRDGAQLVSGSLGAYATGARSTHHQVVAWRHSEARAGSKRAEAGDDEGERLLRNARQRVVEQRLRAREHERQGSNEQPHVEAA